MYNNGNNGGNNGSSGGNGNNGNGGGWGGRSNGLQAMNVGSMGIWQESAGPREVDREVRRLVVTSSSESEEDTTSASDDSTDTEEEALKVFMRLREAKRKTKSKKKKVNTKMTTKKGPCRVQNVRSAYTHRGDDTDDDTSIGNNTAQHIGTAGYYKTVKMYGGNHYGGGGYGNQGGYGTGGDGNMGGGNNGNVGGGNNENIGGGNNGGRTLETNLNEKWRQQTVQAEQAAQKAAQQAIQQAAQLAAQQAAELAVREATERAAQAAESMRRASDFELDRDGRRGSDRDGRREPTRSGRGKKTTSVESENTDMEGSDDSDSQFSDTDESDEKLKKVIIKLQKTRKAMRNQRKEKGKRPAAPPKQQFCKTATEKGESSRGKRYVPCDDDLRCANDIGAGFGAEAEGTRDYRTPQRPVGMRFGLGRADEDRDVCDEPRTPLTGGYKGLPAKSSTTGLIDYCLAAQKVFSTKKAPALQKICQKKGIKYTKKPEVIDLLAREQVMTAYEGFNEGDQSTAGQSTIRLGDATPTATGGERPGSRDRAPRSAPARLNSDFTMEGERRESS
ncbi:hypothetical protein CBR_g4223 [Chara braunii]|uniref:Uncharacterized protein n=1 Tax=Chara braunii TaxID=69332 RepID=A0A388JR64_CHABU|nr:hypothetical protein CBR_g4223 [Chara braunii]|eukprot:GBG60270.1 hypothetical protein CBR_g4223 [Chara braunii]